jgi:hypothetical protein
MFSTLQVVKEVPQPVRSVWPDDKSAMHIMEPAEGLIRTPVEHHILEILHEEFGSDQK